MRAANVCKSNTRRANFDLYCFCVCFGGSGLADVTLLANVGKCQREMKPIWQVAYGEFSADPLFTCNDRSRHAANTCCSSLLVPLCFSEFTSVNCNLVFLYRLILSCRARHVYLSWLNCFAFVSNRGGRVALKFTLCVLVRARRSERQDDSGGRCAHTHTSQRNSCPVPIKAL